MTHLYNPNEFENNLYEILEKSFFNALNNVNEKLLEWYNEIPDEDKSLIDYEDFVSMFKIELGELSSGKPCIVVKLKTPEELLEMYSEVK